MKARVIATGKIVDVYESCSEDFPWTNAAGDKVWKTEELMFLEDIENNSNYWTRLEHQYAGMAMQAYIIASHISQFSFCEGDNDMRDCKNIAHALVEKMKEERK